MVKRGSKGASQKSVNDIESKLDHADHGLVALKALLDAVEGKLDNSTYGLSALKVSIDAVDTLIGALADEPDLMGSVLAREYAIWTTIHAHIGMIVADKNNPPAVVSLIKTELEKKYLVSLLDDDDIDAGSADLEIYDLIFVAGDITDMTKINELTTLGVPIATGNPEVALTILRMGDDSGGLNTSWGTATAQTQVNIVDNTHQITLTRTLGNNTVYTAPGNIQWLRASDLVVDAVELAEISGDNTKSALVVLPYDAPDEDGNPAPMPRVFWGMVEGPKWNSVTETMFYAMLDWLLHQGRRLVEVQGLGRINTVRNMIGTDFSTARNLYDYLVTGTTGAAPFEVITEQEIKSVMERLEWIKNALRRGTGTILPANKSLYDLIALDRLDHASYGLARLMIGTNTAIMAVSTHNTNLNSKYQLLNIDLDKLLTGIIQGTGTVLPADKSLYDLLWVDRHLDESGSFNWDTSVYLTNETDISALFTTALTGTKRRKYWVYLALHNVEGDASFDECYIRIYVKINGTYQCIDKVTKTDANLIAEPGVPVEVPPTAEDAKITLEMKTALAGDQTIDYSWVEEKMEY